MKLLSKRAFGNPDADWWDKLIAIVSLCNFSHTELQFKDGTCFSASLTEGVRFSPPIDTSDTRKWEVNELHGVDEKKAHNHAMTLVGQKYDYRGAFLSPYRVCKFLSFKQGRDKGFCSKVCGNILKLFSNYELDKGCKYSPARLTKTIKEQNKWKKK